MPEYWQCGKSYFRRIFPCVILTFPRQIINETFTYILARVYQWTFIAVLFYSVILLISGVAEIISKRGASEGKLAKNRLKKGLLILIGTIVAYSAIQLIWFETTTCQEGVP